MTRQAGRASRPDTPALGGQCGMPGTCTRLASCGWTRRRLSVGRSKLADVPDGLRIAQRWTTISSTYKRVVLPQLVIT